MLSVAFKVTSSSVAVPAEPRSNELFHPEEHPGSVRPTETADGVQGRAAGEWAPARARPRCASPSLERLVCRATAGQAFPSPLPPVLLSPSLGCDPDSYFIEKNKNKRFSVGNFKLRAQCLKMCRPQSRGSPLNVAGSLCSAECPGAQESYVKTVPPVFWVASRRSTRGLPLSRLLSRARVRGLPLLAGPRRSLYAYSSLWLLKQTAPAPSPGPAAPPHRVLLHGEPLNAACVHRVDP